MDHPDNPYAALFFGLLFTLVVGGHSVDRYKKIKTSSAFNRQYCINRGCTCFASCWLLLSFSQETFLKGRSSFYSMSISRNIHIKGVYAKGFPRTIQKSIHKRYLCHWISGIIQNSTHKGCLCHGDFQNHPKVYS